MRRKNKMKEIIQFVNFEDVKKKVKVKSVRYWQTSRYVGYEAKTNYGTIWNNGDGCGSFFEPTPENGALRNVINEDMCEKLIDIYEGVNDEN
jgi:hypothetical protein